MAHNIVETMTDDNKRAHAITKGSVQALFLWYALANAAGKSLKELLDNATDLAKKLDDAPLLQKRVVDLIATQDKAKIKQLNKLLDKVVPSKLERLIGKIDANKVDLLLDDIAGNTSLRKALAGNEGLIDSWKHASDAFANGSKFITDIPTLEKISKLASEGSSFRNKLGSNWQEALDDILKNANDLKCSSCGNSGRIGRSSMDQYLDDVDHFIKNFDVSSGGKGEVFYNWMRNTTNPTSGQLDELHQTIRDFAKRGLKESDVVDIGKQFPIGTKKYDLQQIGGKFTEYKNKDFVTYPLTASSSDVDQFINGYLKNVDNLDKLEWKVGLEKLTNKGWIDANALSNMKSQWKNVFESKTDEVFETIWGNQNLKNSLFDTGLTKAEAKLDFADMVSTTDDTLFKFIKVE